jgi:F0F1-type ATP synthase epsilon subunit
LADFAEHLSELSDAVIEKAKARAEELKKLMENKEHVDFEHFEAELERSLTRVKIADKWRTKKYRK